jgi:hypothetical protein
MADNNYNPHLQGSDTLPSSNCDASVAKETAADVAKAREAVRLHKIANSLAERGNRK